MDFATFSPSCDLLDPADPSSVVGRRNICPLNLDKGNVDVMWYDSRGAVTGSGPSGHPLVHEIRQGEAETCLSLVITDVSFPERLSIPVQAESERPQMSPIPAQGKPCLKETTNQVLVPSLWSGRNGEIVLVTDISWVTGKD